MLAHWINAPLFDPANGASVVGGAKFFGVSKVIASRFPAIQSVTRGSVQFCACCYCSMTSKPVVITAVFPSIKLAEQYFSWLIAIARSTACGGSALPVTTKCI